MSQFQQGQIWLVNFEPSFGHEYKKVRPVLYVLSSLSADQIIETSGEVETI